MELLPFTQFFDDNGDPLSGGKVYTYQAGTTTPAVTYRDRDGNAANTNPIILDSGGRCQIWIGSGSFKLVVKDADDVQIEMYDKLAIEQLEGTGPVLSGGIEGLANQTGADVEGLLFDKDEIDSATLYFTIKTATKREKRLITFIWDGAAWSTHRGQIANELSGITIDINSSTGQVTYDSGGETFDLIWKILESTAP